MLSGIRSAACRRHQTKRLWRAHAGCALHLSGKYCRHGSSWIRERRHYVDKGSGFGGSDRPESIPTVPTHCSTLEHRSVAALGLLSARLGREVAGTRANFRKLRACLWRDRPLHLYTQPLGLAASVCHWERTMGQRSHLSCEKRGYPRY